VNKFPHHSYTQKKGWLPDRASKKNLESIVSAGHIHQRSGADAGQNSEIVRFSGLLQQPRSDELSAQAIPLQRKGTQRADFQTEKGSIFAAMQKTYGLMKQPCGKRRGHGHEKPRGSNNRRGIEFLNCCG
jgi:hypothetical protein